LIQKKTGFFRGRRSFCSSDDTDQKHTIPLPRLVRPGEHVLPEGSDG